MLRKKKIIGLLLTTFLSSTFVFAIGQPTLPQQQQQQQDVTEKEIKQYAAAFKEVRRINQKTQQEMVSVVREEGLEVDQFNEIYEAQQNPEKEADVSEQEVQKFNNASKKIENIQNQSQQKMQKGIEDAGLSIKRYQQIAAQVQGDSDLQKKVQEHL